MVPTFTCGFLRSNTPFAMSKPPSQKDFQFASFNLRFAGRDRVIPRSQIANRKSIQSWHRGLNPGPPPYQGGALPLSYASDATATSLGPVRCDKLCAYRDLRRAESINREEAMSINRCAPPQTASRLYDTQPFSN